MAAQHGANAGAELLGVERLGQVVVGAASSPLAVSMMIGRRLSSSRRRRQIDSPSSPGSIRSSTISE